MDSCLDMQVIVAPDAVVEIEAEWQRHAPQDETITELLRAGRFSDLHLDVWDGVLAPGTIDEEGQIVLAACGLGAVDPVG